MEITLDFEGTIDEREDIMRCLNTLYGTRAGSQPMDREFGLNYDPVDMEGAEMRNALALEIITKTERYEKRVEVDSVDYKYEPINGKVNAIIHLIPGEEDTDDD